MVLSYQNLQKIKISKNAEKLPVFGESTKMGIRLYWSAVIRFDNIQHFLPMNINFVFTSIVCENLPTEVEKKMENGRFTSRKGLLGHTALFIYSLLYCGLNFTLIQKENFTTLFFFLKWDGFLQTIRGWGWGWGWVQNKWFQSIRGWGWGWGWVQNKWFQSIRRRLWIRAESDHHQRVRMSSKLVISKHQTTRPDQGWIGSSLEGEGEFKTSDSKASHDDRFEPCLRVLRQACSGINLHRS